MSHILKAKRIMSKRNIIDAFFKKQDVSNSEIRTPVAVKTNVNTSMPDEHPSKCPNLQFEEIDRDPGSRKQICEFPVNKYVNFLSTNKMKSDELISKKVHINLKI